MKLIGVKSRGVECQGELHRVLLWKVCTAQTGDLISFFKGETIWTWTIMFLNMVLVFVVVFSIISKPVHVFLIKVTALTLCSDLQIVMGKISKPSITAHFANKWQLFTTQNFQLFFNNFAYVCTCVHVCVRMRVFDLTFPLCKMLFAYLNKMKTINQIMYPASFNTVPPLNYICCCFFLL